MKRTGLLDRIKAASPADVKALLVEGRGYKRASDGTRRKWQRAAAAKL